MHSLVGSSSRLSRKSGKALTLQPYSQSLKETHLNNSLAHPKWSVSKSLGV